MKLYIGQGLRQDLAQHFADRVLEKTAEVSTRHLQSTGEVSAILEEIRTETVRWRGGSGFTQRGENFMAVTTEITTQVATGVALDPERAYEIVDGQPEEKEVAGAKHGGAASRLIRRLGAFVEAHNLGEVYSETRFQIGHNERIPDVAFVSLERFPPEGEPEGKWPVAPDLAVEVISPNDIFDKVLSKMKEYFAAGVRQVWLISTEHKIVIIHRSLAQATFLSEDDELMSEDLLPGFRCRVSELFKSPAKRS